jgi:hypothetical protein
MAAGPKRQSGWKTTRHSDSFFSRLHPGHPSRQYDSKFGERSGLGVDLYGSAVLLDDDVMTDGQAQSGSFTGGLGCKERIEHLLLHLGRHAGAVVADPDLDAVAEILGRGS